MPPTQQSLAGLEPRPERGFGASDLPARSLAAGGGSAAALGAALVLLLVPAVTLAYLPMTDLPQHLAAVSILLNLNDPRYGFAAFYQTAWDRTLYALPYLMTMAFAPFASLELGMRVVVVLSLASLPIGLFALLRALGKAEWLALLSLPLVYNRAFFWGFTNFQLSMDSRCWRSRSWSARRADGAPSFRSRSCAR